MLDEVSKHNILSSDGFILNVGLDNYKNSYLSDHKNPTQSELKKNLSKDIYNACMFEAYNYYSKESENCYVTNKMIKHFSNMGFDALEDAYNKTGYFGANNPLKILNADSVLKENTKVKDLPVEEIMDHYKNLSDFIENWEGNKQLRKYHESQK